MSHATALKFPCLFGLVVLSQRVLIGINRSNEVSHLYSITVFDLNVSPVDGSINSSSKFVFDVINLSVSVIFLPQISSMSNKTGLVPFLLLDEIINILVKN